jgi:predicted CoA-binding protein
LISIIEIYNQNANDLLNSVNVNIDIREDRYSKNIFVQGLSKIEIKTPEEVLHYIEKGHEIITIAPNGFNEKSSRSRNKFCFEA